MRELVMVYTYISPIHQWDFPGEKKRFCSMYGKFTYIWSVFMVDVGKYTIH